MISGATIGFIIFFMLVATVIMAFGAAWVITHHSNQFGRWAAAGLGIMSMMIAIPMIVIVGRIATAIY